SQTRRLVQDAREALAGGDDAQAEALLEEAVALEPANPEADLLLAKLVVFKDPARATQLSHTHGADFAEAEAVRRVAGALTEGAPSDPPEDAARLPYAAAIAALQDGDADVALSQLVDSVRRNRHFHDEAARKLALALFSVLGDKHPLTQKHRRALERALF
ncbi:MAG TPA: tetratricopeptide repeat protein, partial [Dehalococcoidia bacterium]